MCKIAYCLYKDLMFYEMIPGILNAGIIVSVFIVEKTSRKI